MAVLNQLARKIIEKESDLFAALRSDPRRGCEADHLPIHDVGAVEVDLHAHWKAYYQAL